MSNLAVAYAMKKRTAKKKMAEGGEIAPEKIESDVAEKTIPEAETGTVLATPKEEIEKKAAPIAQDSGGMPVSSGGAGVEALSAGMKSLGEGFSGAAIKNMISKAQSDIEGLIGGGGGAMMALAMGGMAKKIMAKRGNPPASADADNLEMGDEGWNDPYSFDKGYKEEKQYQNEHDAKYLKANPTPGKAYYAKAAHGGLIEDLQDQEEDDSFLSHGMEPVFGDEEEDLEAKRKGMIGRIMEGLHNRHYGK